MKNDQTILITFINNDQISHVLSLDDLRQPWVYYEQLNINHQFGSGGKLLDFIEDGNFEDWHIHDLNVEPPTLKSNTIHTGLNYLLMYIVNDYVNFIVNEKQVAIDDPDMKYEIFDDFYGYVVYNPLISEVFKQFNIQGTSDLIEWYENNS